MIKRYLFIILSILLFTFSSVFSVSAQEEQEKQPELEEIADNVYRIDKLIVDLNKKEMIINGWINMQNGQIELFACTSWGKTHESVLVLDVQPYCMQVGLILLGLEYEGGLRFQGDPLMPKGDSVEVWVGWESEEGDTLIYRAEDLIYNIVEYRSELLGYHRLLLIVELL